jgi:hypothetical protein
MSEAPDGVRISRQQPGGAAPLLPSQPVPSDAPAPDSQGLWLDAFVFERGHAIPSTLPPSRPSVAPSASSVPGSEVSSSTLDVYPSSLEPRGFVIAPTLPPESMGTPELVDTEGVRIEFADVEVAGSVPTVPAPGAPRLTDRGRAAGIVPSVDAATCIERTFAHRGPLSATEALAFARAAEEVKLVLQIVARFARQYFERLVVFAVEGETAEARLAHGTGPRTPLLLIDLSGDGLLARAARTGAPFVGDLTSDSADVALRASLGGLDGGAPVAVLPMTLRGQVIVLLYLDDLGLPVDRDGLAAVEELCELAAEEMARILLAGP